MTPGIVNSHLVQIREIEMLVPLRTYRFGQSHCLYRCPEKKVHTEFSNHLTPSAISQPLPPHSRPPSSPGLKSTTADFLNDMKNWAKSKISTKATGTPSQLQKTDLGCQQSHIPKPFLLQETELGHPKFQKFEPPLLEPAVLECRKSQILEASPLQPLSSLGYRKSQILEPPPQQPTDLGYQKPQIIEPSPVQPTDLRYQKAQIPKPPRLHKTDPGCRKSQIVEPPPLQEFDLGYQKSQILEPHLLQLTDNGYQKTQILESPPSQPTDLGHIKSQMPKPPRPQKSDSECHNPQISETLTTNQTQQTDALESNNPFRPTAVQESSPPQTYQKEIHKDGALFQAPSICLTVEDPYFGPYSEPMFTGSKCTEAVPRTPCFTGPDLVLKTQTIELPVQDSSTGENTNVPGVSMAHKDFSVVNL